MDYKKRNSGEEPFESLMQEMESESSWKAPPPTPSLSLKQKSGSVPDVRISEVFLKEKSVTHRNSSQSGSSHRKTVLKAIVELNGKKSSSDHSLMSRNAKVLHWLVMGQAPTTSHLLHSVRQKLLNL